MVVLTEETRAEPKAEKTFTAVVTNAQGVDTEVRNLIFYWEEKVSDTAFVPHELRHLPVERGSMVNSHTAPVFVSQDSSHPTKSFRVASVTPDSGSTHTSGAPDQASWLFLLQA
jgi:hypothetical protein